MWLTLGSDLAIADWRDRRRATFEVRSNGACIASVVGQVDGTMWRIHDLRVDPAWRGLGLRTWTLVRLAERLDGRPMAIHVVPHRLATWQRRWPRALMGRDPSLPGPTARQLLWEAKQTRPASDVELLLALCAIAGERMVRRTAGRIEGWLPQARFFCSLGFRLRRGIRDPGRARLGCGVRLDYISSGPLRLRAPDPLVDLGPMWRLLPK